MTQMTVEDFDGMTCEVEMTLEPMGKGNTPASPSAPLPPGGCVDGPGPEQRWPYAGDD